MGPYPWTVPPTDPYAGSRRRVDRWANPHLRGRQLNPSGCRPRQTGLGLQREANGEDLLIERREAWNVGK